MSNFHEFTALWRKEKSKEDKELDRAIHGEVENIYLPGYETGRISIRLSAVIAYNEVNFDDEGTDEYTHISVELQGGERYRIDMKYDDFKELLKEFYQ